MRLDYHRGLPTTQDVPEFLQASYVNAHQLATKECATFLVTQAYVANLPGISLRTYGTQDYWRALMWVNGIRDPLNEVIIGMRLKTPDRGVLDAFLKDRFSTKEGLQCLSR